MNDTNFKLAELHKQLDNIKFEEIRNEDSYLPLLSLIESYEKLINENIDSDSEEKKEIVSKASAMLGAICWKLKRVNDELLNPTQKAAGAENVYALVFRGGLCNRLRMICSLRAMCTATGASFRWSWAANKDCGEHILLSTESGYSNFSKLLKNYIEDINNGRSCALLTDPDPASLVHKKHGLAETIGLDFSQFNQLYKTEQTSLLAELKIALNLSEEVDHLIGKLPEKFLAAHIRRTDMLDHWNKTFPGYQYPTVENYIQLVQELANGTSFFVCCDDRSTINEFVEQFKGRAVYHDGTFTESAFRQTSMSHAFIDLFVLSKSTELIVTPGSSFSDFAANMGKTAIHKPPMKPL